MIKYIRYHSFLLALFEDVESRLLLEINLDIFVCESSVGGSNCINSLLEEVLFGLVESQFSE